jgi:hypothetical protein
LFVPSPFPSFRLSYAVVCPESPLVVVIRLQEIKGLQRRRYNKATLAQIGGYGIGIAA